ncbi:hypothetical protein Tco_0160806, partial [Tanacetum coccineum]
MTEALEDGSWVEAMQEELLQFKLQQLRKKRKSKEAKDAEGQDQEVLFETDQGDTFVTPEKSKGSGEAQEEQISPSTLGGCTDLNKSQVNTGEVNAAEVNTGEVNAAEVNTGEAERAQR